MGKYDDYLDNPHKYLGAPVRIFVSNRVRTGKWTEWSESSQSYSGHVEINVKEEGFSELPRFVPFKGSVPLGKNPRPDADFQAVAPGEDESQLLAISTGNATPTPPPVEVVVEDTAELPTMDEAPSQTFDPADLNKDGTTTEKEQRKYDRQHKGE